MKEHWWMNKGKKFFVIGSIALIAILNACTDNPGNLTPQVLPKSDLISAFQSDTTTIVTSMYLKDSVSTNSYGGMLGSINDPVFGQSKASLYIQVFPSGNSTIPWANPNHNSSNTKVDSIVLLLPVAGIYGNNDPQTFAVYRLHDSIVIGHNYYSDTAMRLYSKTPIGQAQVIPPNGISNDTLRIRLNNNFMSYFLSQVLGAPDGLINNLPSNWSSTFNTNLGGVMQGICITPENPLQLPGQGGIIYTNLVTSFEPGIYVYYHYLIPNDTEHYLPFPVGGTSELFYTNITHDYSTSPIGASRPSGTRDSIAAGQLIYVQAMGGVLGRITFPYLYKTWSKLGPIAINEAELTLPVDAQYSSNVFAPPSQLYVQSTGSNWQRWPLPDQGQSYYGGTYTYTNGGYAYSFVITQYIQSIIDGKNDSDRGLYIFPVSTGATANRVVLYGAQHGSLPTVNKATLTIYYTPLKKN